MADSAEFVRKPINMKDLKEHYYGSFRCGFEVEKIAELSREQLESFPVNCMGIIGFYMTTVTPCIWIRETGGCTASL